MRQWALPETLNLSEPETGDIPLCYCSSPRHHRMEPWPMSSYLHSSPYFWRLLIIISVSSTTPSLLACLHWFLVLLPEHWWDLLQYFLILFSSTRMLNSPLSFTSLPTTIQTILGRVCDISIWMLLLVYLTLPCGKAWFSDFGLNLVLGFQRRRSVTLWILTYFSSIFVGFYPSKLK